jgi:hypothetical protein
MKNVNRTLICKVTGREIIVKPDKYKKLLEYYGTEEKVKDNFVCYNAEIEIRTPRFEYWFSHCEEMADFKSKLFEIFKTFKDSGRTMPDVQVLQTESIKLLNNNGLSDKNIEFIQTRDEKSNYVNGIKLKGIPFIKQYSILWEKK